MVKGLCLWLLIVNRNQTTAFNMLMSYNHYWCSNTWCKLVFFVDEKTLSTDDTWDQSGVTQTVHNAKCEADTGNIFVTYTRSWYILQGVVSFNWSYGVISTRYFVRMIFKLQQFYSPNQGTNAQIKMKMTVHLKKHGASYMQTIWWAILWQKTKTQFGGLVIWLIKFLRLKAITLTEGWHGKQKDSS